MKVLAWIGACPIQDRFFVVEAVYWLTRQETESTRLRTLPINQS